MEGWLTVGGCVVVGGILVVLVFLLRAVRLLYEYERGVVFTLGKYAGTRDPGLTLIIPVVQSMRKVDMRIKTAEIPRRPLKNPVVCWICTLTT